MSGEDGRQLKELGVAGRELVLEAQRAPEVRHFGRVLDAFGEL